MRSLVTASLILSLLFSSLFVSFPVFAEVFYFANQSDVIAIGMLLSGIGALLICNYVLLSKSLWQLLLGIILGSLSTGCYQAFLYLFIAEVLALSILYVYYSDMGESLNVYLKYAFKLIGIIIAVTILYFSVCNVVRSFLFQPEMEYAGQINSKEYIANSVAWKNRQFRECIVGIVDYIISSVQIEYLFNGFGFFAAFLLSLTLVTWRGLTEKNIKYVYVFLLFMALGITPYLGAIVKGMALRPREQLVLPFVYAFTVAFIYDTLKKVRYLKQALVVLVLYISWCQSLITLRLFYTDYMRYQHDYSTILQITNTAAEKYGALDDKVIVYYGKKVWVAPEGHQQGGVIGNSILQWDHATQGGVNYRINYFSKSLGLTTNIPTMDQIQIGYQIAKELEVWPSADSMAIEGNIVVVKLSD